MPPPLIKRTSPYPCPYAYPYPTAADTEEEFSVSDVKSTLICSLGLALCRQKKTTPEVRTESILRAEVM